MKRLWLILPLLLAFSCEDKEEKIPFEGFSEAWIECKILSSVYVTEKFETESQEYSYDSLTVETVWNGLSSTNYDGTYREYNQWGMVINYNNTSFIEYQDKWKKVKETGVSENGDTSSITISSWDGLLKTTHSYYFGGVPNTIKYVVYNKTLYNEYGRILEHYNYSDYSEPPLDSMKFGYTYEDGWRLIRFEEYDWKSTDIKSTREYQWVDNKRIYIDEQKREKYVEEETYNFYWKLIKREWFYYYLNDDNEWELNFRVTIYTGWECPGFKQIYP